MHAYLPSSRKLQSWRRAGHQDVKVLSFLAEVRISISARLFVLQTSWALVEATCWSFRTYRTLWWCTIGSVRQDRRPSMSRAAHDPLAEVAEPDIEAIPPPAKQHSPFAGFAAGICSG